MQDDQWPPANRGGQRERKPDSGPLPPPRGGQGRPPNAANPGNPTRFPGNPNQPGAGQPGMPLPGGSRPLQQGGNSGPFQRPGNSAPLSRPQPPAPGDGWGPSSTSTFQQRRGPSGSLNSGGPANGGRPGAGGPPPAAGPRGGTNSYPSTTGGPAGRKPSGPTGPGGPGRGTNWADEEQRWLGPENGRPSRGVSSPLDRPGTGRPGARGPTGQWSGGNQRGWNAQDEDDEEEEPGWGAGRAAQPRGAPNQRRPSGPQGGPGRPASAGGGQGGWNVQVPSKGRKSSGGSNPLRTKLIVTLLLVVVILGASVVLVPSIRHRVLSYLPGHGSTTTNQPTGTVGDVTMQVNVPSAKVTLDTQTATTQPGPTAPFSAVTFQGVAAGDHTISVHADNFSDVTKQPITVKPGPNSWTAWLAPTADALTAALGKYGPTTQPDGGVATDHYGSPPKTATGPFTVSISYTVSGLDPKAFTNSLPAGTDTTKSPFPPATITLVPVVTFKDANGATLATYSPPALPAAQFSLQAIPAVDTLGAVTIGASGPTIKTSGGQTVPTTFSGPAKNDYALYYAIAAVLPASPANPLNFLCVGAVDNKNFNPEDGLLVVDTADDTAHAHYFYRWGILWATNGLAHTLTPTAPMAQAGGSEFQGANQARANASCGT